MLIENKSAKLIVINKVRIAPLEQKEVDIKGIEGKQKSVIDAWFKTGALAKVRQARRKKDEQVQRVKDEQVETPEAE